MGQKIAVEFDSAGFRLMVGVLASRGLRLRWIDRLLSNNGPEYLCKCLKSFKAYAWTILAGKPVIDHLQGWKVINRYGIKVPRIASHLFCSLIRAVRQENYGIIRLVMSALALGGWVVGKRHSEVVTELQRLSWLVPCAQVDESEALKSMSKFLECHHIGLYSLKDHYDYVNNQVCEPTNKSVAVYPGLNGSFIEALAAWQVLMNEMAPHRYFAGNLTPLVKDGGMKVRFVGVCNPWLNHMLGNLKSFLFSCLAKLSSDCTLDQTNGRSFLCAATIRADKEISCIDMTDWTYHFPNVIQKLMLKSLGVPSETIQAMFDSYWSTVVDLGPNAQFFTQIRKGQVMGLGPSWPLAALCHHWVVWDLCQQVGVNYEEVSRILGDDLILTDHTVAEKYMQLMENWQVPVSKGKTFQSCNFGDFAGRSYLNGVEIHPLRFKGDWQTFRSNKWELISVLGKRPYFQILDYMLSSKQSSLRRTALESIQDWSLPTPWGLGMRLPYKILSAGKVKLMCTNFLLKEARKYVAINFGTNVLPSRVRPLMKRLKLTQEDWLTSWEKDFESVVSQVEVRIPVGMQPLDRRYADIASRSIQTPPLQLGCPEWLHRIPSPAKVTTQLGFIWEGLPQLGDKRSSVSLRKLRKTVDLAALVIEARERTHINNLRLYNTRPFSELLKDLAERVPYRPRFLEQVL